MQRKLIPFAILCFVLLTSVDGAIAGRLLGNRRGRHRGWNRWAPAYSPNVLPSGLTDVDNELTETDDETFTVWMSLEEMLRHRAISKQNGLWAAAFEGRWRDGASQFRVREVPAPAVRFRWGVRIDQDEKSFVEYIKKYSSQGLHLVHSQSFADGDGLIKFQGVWQWVESESTQTPSARVNPPSVGSGEMEAIYQALKITNVRIVGGPFSPGDIVKVSYRLTNTSDSEFRVPVNESYSRPFNLVGVRQHWIRRQGDDDSIPGISRRTAKRGQKFAAGGSIIPTEAVIAAGASWPFQQRVSTKGYPAGKYTYYIEYRKMGGGTLQMEEIDFELANK